MFSIFDLHVLMDILLIIDDSHCFNAVFGQFGYQYELLKHIALAGPLGVSASSIRAKWCWEMQEKARSLKFLRSKMTKRVHTSHLKHTRVLLPTEVRDVMFCWSVDLVLERQWIGSKCSYYKASSYFQVLPPPHLAGELHNFWWTKEAPTWLNVEVQVDRTWKYLDLNVFATASLWNI